MRPKAQQFAPYLPSFLLRYFGSNPTPPTQARGDRFPGVALFADVAGSTKICNELTRISRLQGPEEMYRIFNAYYEPLVTLLNKRGGDVVGFAGDAVLAIWPVAEGESLTPALRQATQASLEAQRDLNGLELAPGVRLTMRICIGVGELVTSLVGGRQKFWQLVASGPPLDQIRDAGSLARIGEVYLSREACEVLGGGELFDPQPGGGHFVRRLSDSPGFPEPLPDVSTMPEEILRLFVQQNVQASIDAGLGDFMDQARTVSVLFVRVGRRPGEPQSCEFIQEAMNLLQEASLKYEGTVAQFIEDDKGLVSLLAFGLPMAGHEDDTDRAIDAALFLQDPVNNRGIPCAIGASMGLPFCGALGSPGRRVVYTVTGSDVVRAARLMQLAREGEVLCDEDTYEATSKKSRFNYTAMPRFKLKGYDEPARVFRVARAEGSRSQQSLRLYPVIPPGDDPIGAIACERFLAKKLGPHLDAVLRERDEEDPLAILSACERLIAEDLVITENGVCEVTEGTAHDGVSVDCKSVGLIGRTAERTTLVNSLDAVVAGSSRAILIEGDIGVGKSRLVDEATHLALERNLLACVGHCSSVESSTPYFPWRIVCETLAGLHEIEGPAERNDRVLAVLAGAPETLPYAPLLNGLLGLTLPETEETSQMVGQNRADNLVAVLVGLIASATEGRAVFIALEDVQWADASSWRLAKMVREKLGRVALVLSLRRPFDSPPAEYEPFVSADWADRIALEALSEETTCEFARARFGAEKLAEPLAQLIWRKTQGNPLFIEQITEHLAESKALVSERGIVGLRPGSAETIEAIPDTIRGLITARIDRLRPAHQLTAKVSSVIGPLFAPTTLTAIHPDRNEASAVPEHIRLLTQEHVYRQNRPDSDQEYEFPHPVVQQVCYELLTRPQRQKLHFSAAEWYQAADASSGTQFRLIAHHWGRAKVVEKQVEFLAKAGEAAIRDGAFREAATGFTEILDVSRAQYGDAPPPEEATRRAHWEHQLGQAYFGLGDLPQATEHLRKSLELRGWPFRASTRGRIADTLVQFFRQLTHRVRPGWHLADRVDPELREVAATYLRLGRISYYNSDILAGTNAVLRALNVAEMIGPSRELAVAYASVTVLTGMLRWQRAARVYAPLTESIARQVCGMQDRSLVFAYLCMWNLGQGHWDRVDTLAREALELAERISDHAQRSEMATILAMMNCFRANYAEAAHWTATMFDGAKRSGNTMHAAWATNILGECDIRQGRSADAVVKMQESAAALHGNKDRTEEIRIHGMLAGLAVRSGNLSEAARHADVAEAVANEATGITCSTLEGFAGIVETRVTQVERDPKNPAARKAVKAALASLKKYAKTYPIGRPRLALYEGRMCLLDGATAKALKIWRSGQTLAATLRLPFDEALLHEILTQYMPPNSAERQVHRESAVRLYEQVGAVVELQRLRDRAP